MNGLAGSTTAIGGLIWSRACPSARSPVTAVIWAASALRIRVRSAMGCGLPFNDFQISHRLVPVHPSYAPVIDVSEGWQFPVSHQEISLPIPESATGNPGGALNAMASAVLYPPGDLAGIAGSVDEYGVTLHEPGQGIHCTGHEI